MKILVTGAEGQLGNELKALGMQGEVEFTDVAQLDLLDFAQVEQKFEDEGYGLVINCAAYTAVDKAEEDEELAGQINAHAVANLAQQCIKHQAKLIHVSTDYVFDGTKSSPYLESDPTNPQSVYGRTKLAGEEAALSSGAEVMIFRTSWVFSSYGNNFVKTILRLAGEKDELSIVADQIGGPTYAADLAQVIAKVEEDLSLFQQGIFHFADEGVASWYDFTLAIVEMAGLECRIKPIRTQDYPLPATRPAYSLFNKHKIKEALGIEIPHWRDSLQICLKKILS